MIRILTQTDGLLALAWCRRRRCVGRDSGGPTDGVSVVILDVIIQEALLAETLSTRPFHALELVVVSLDLELLPCHGCRTTRSCSNYVCKLSIERTLFNDLL